MIAAYGIGVLTLPYDIYQQLYLNLSRVRIRHGLAVASALAMLWSDETPGREWADALGTTPAEIEEIHFHMRSRAAAARRRGQGGF